MRGISAHSNGFDTCRMIHVLQMLLGAAFRHQFAPVWPHIAGSFLAACLLLMAAMSIYDHYAAHPRLKRYGPWLLGITLSQLALGLGDVAHHADGVD